MIRLRHDLVPPGTMRHRRVLQLQRRQADVEPFAEQRQGERETMVVHHAGRSPRIRRRRSARLPLRTANGLERRNEEIKPGTPVATLFANEASLLRRAPAAHADISDDWETECVHLNMEAR